jgi:hypothetical protein
MARQAQCSSSSQLLSPCAALSPSYADAHAMTDPLAQSTPLYDTMHAIMSLMLPGGAAATLPLLLLVPG